MSSWTDERVATAQKLWKDGCSAQQIADELGGISRNAVIGKIHRTMGAGHHSSSHPRVAPSPPRPPRARAENGGGGLKGPSLPALKVKDTVEQTDIEIPTEQRRTFAELRLGTVSTPGSCRWPVGSPGTPGFFFCGADAELQRPYCAHHGQVASGGKPTHRTRTPKSNGFYHP